MTLWRDSLAQQSLSYQAGLYLVGRKALEEAPIPTRYEILRSLYQSNGMYDAVARTLYDDGEWLPARKPIANPTAAVVDFYGAKLLAGPPLEIAAENERLAAPVEQFWRWSNFDALRPLLGRQAARDGDTFLKVASKPIDPANPAARGNTKSVYLELIDPANVRAFDLDERGFVTWIRIEVPKCRRNRDGTLTDYIHVEVWSKADQLYRRWEWDNRRGNIALLPDDDLDRLGDPTAAIPLPAMGLDFPPIVHAPFIRSDTDRHGEAAVWRHIEKIVELDLIVTELHRKYYGYDIPSLVLYKTGTSSDPRPAPAPSFKEMEQANGKDAVSVGREKAFGVPGGWDLKYLVAQLDFEAGRKLIEDHYKRLEHLMPELLYGRMAELGGNGGDLSGRAVRFLFAPAIDRVLESRGNLEAALVRCDQIALTLMAFAGLVADVGTYEAGDFEHSFAERDVLPLSDLEDAQGELAKAQAFAAWTQAGLPVTMAAQRLGYTEQESLDMVAMMTADVEQQANQGGQQ